MQKIKKKITWKNVLVVAVAVVLIFSLISMIAVKLIYDNQFPRYERHDETITAGLRYDDYAEKYPRSLLQFKSGNNNLQGYLYGESSQQGLVIVSHGIGGGADTYLPQIFYFLDQGWQVFAYDATGSFDSEGKSTRGFPQSLLDLKAALDYIDTNSQLSKLDKVLFGHSWGGYAVAAVLGDDYAISGVVSVAAPDTAMGIVLEQARHMMGMFADIQYPFLWMYQRMLFGKAADISAIDAINSADVPILIIHGTEDEMVSYTGSAIIARMDQITNENVRSIAVSEAGRNGHNSLFRSQAAIAYIDEVNKNYRQLYDLHEQNIPYDIDQAFYKTLDRSLAQDLNQELMGQINQFFLDCTN